MVQYGLTIENQALICDKAKLKRDGVYNFRGVAYRVRDSRITHLAVNGEILIPYGHFNVIVGRYENLWSSSGKKALSLKIEEK